jgi:hypothetical protein
MGTRLRDVGLATGVADESFDGQSDTDEGSIPLIWRRRARPGNLGQRWSGDTVLDENQGYRRK